jgi:hypothetical protein
MATPIAMTYPDQTTADAARQTVRSLDDEVSPAGLSELWKEPNPRPRLSPTELIRACRRRLGAMILWANRSGLVELSRLGPMTEREELGRGGRLRSDAAAGWPGEGRLRQPRFLGRRDERRPTDVITERPT